MFNKIKIIFFSLLPLASALMGASAAWGQGDEFFVPGAERLRAAVWQLGAFVPATEGEPYSVRRLAVNDVPGLQPAEITLKFDEPLNPWPAEIIISLQAEAGDPALFFTLSDRRPFGGQGVTLGGLPPEGHPGESPPELFLKILERVNLRLSGGLPTMTPVEWREEAEGLSAAEGRLLYGARQGQGELHLLRLDPARYALRPFHESNFPGEGPTDMSGWAERLPGAAAIINGGQYYPDRAYMGLLRQDGVDFSAGIHKSWKGFLVSGPADGAPPGAPPAAIIDMETHSGPWLPDDYCNVMQSFMMLDSLGRVRVKDSRNLAARAAIAQDYEGRLILIMTPAAVSLYDLATALKKSDLGLKSVMGLDGGFEAQLMIRGGPSPLISGGHFSITEKRALFLPGYSPSLPAVLAVEPRQRPAPR